MAITLDAATEERIQQQLDCGSFAGPDELLTHALDLIETEKNLETRRAAIFARLEESCLQADRGEGYTEQELRARMAERRAA